MYLKDYYRNLYGMKNNFRNIAIGVFVFTLFVSFVTPGNFKTNQKKYSRDRTAYKERESAMKQLLEKKNLKIEGLQVYISI